MIFMSRKVPAPYVATLICCEQYDSRLEVLFRGEEWVGKCGEEHLPEIT